MILPGVEFRMMTVESAEVELALLVMGLCSKEQQRQITGC